MHTDIAKVVFNKCCEADKDKSKVEYNYEFLEDYRAKQTSNALICFSIILRLWMIETMNILCGQLNAPCTTCRRFN